MKLWLASAILKPYITFIEDIKSDTIAICDAVAMSIVLNPFVASAPYNSEACVELSGSLTRGSIVWNRLGHKQDNFIGPIIMYKNFDIKIYEKMLEDAVV